MVEEQIRGRGVRDPRVLEAMMTVPREVFVPESSRDAAYADHALAVGHDQTISQPYIVAYMTEQLSLFPEAKVLEVGTGTGYQTALLALLAEHVYTIERIEALQKSAARKLAELDITNVTMVVGDGSMGLDAHAPYDRVIVTAAAPHVPQPLVEQLVEGGLMVLPVGGRTEQSIVRVERRGQRTVETPLLACRFVRLVGNAGWEANDS